VKRGTKDTIISLKRSLLKTISYRCVAMIGTMVIAYIFTGSLVVSIGIGMVEIVIKLLLFFLHDAFWERFIP